MSRIEESKEDARNLNELTDQVIKLLELDDKRFSFVFCAGGIMEICDNEKEIGYVVNIAPIERNCGQSTGIGGLAWLGEQSY